MYQRQGKNIQTFLRIQHSHSASHSKTASTVRLLPQFSLQSIYSKERSWYMIF